MRQISVISSLSIVLVFLAGGCADKDKTPPPDFYEFEKTAGDGFVTFAYNFPGLDNHKYGVEITYYLDGDKKVKREFGAFSMTIQGLTNNETYTFTLVTYDEAGNRSDGFEIKATPNLPFVLISPTGIDDYTIENGKVRIDLRFNRSADTSEPFTPFMDALAGLYTDSSSVPYSYSWLGDGLVFSLLTIETTETLCGNLPCNLYLRIRFPWVGNMIYDGFRDTNGMLLDGDNDGIEGGDADLTFVIK